jgi:hypothetical protein
MLITPASERVGMAEGDMLTDAALHPKQFSMQYPWLCGIAVMI